MTSTLGERIRTARTEAGYTTEALARALNVSTRTVARWQDGKASGRPSYERLVLLSQILQKPLAWFLEGGANGQEAA